MPESRQSNKPTKQEAARQDQYSPMAAEPECQPTFVQLTHEYWKQQLSPGGFSFAASHVSPYRPRRPGEAASPTQAERRPAVA